MAIYNSFSNSNQNDTNLTMIDPSLVFGQDDESTRHLQRVDQSKSTKHPPNFDEKYDYIYVEHDRLDAAKQIQQILNYYRQDLKQESNTQLDCNQQLITRLIDFIRPAYSNQREKMKELDNFYEEISDLQDIRFIDQKEKNEQLNKEVLQLKKLIITSTNDGDKTKVCQRSEKISPRNLDSMVTYEQWIEMEEETKQLQNLVETQRDRINELIQLISQEAEPPIIAQPPTTCNPQSAKPQASDPIYPELPNEKRSSSALRTLTRLPSFNDIKKCPICNHEFLRTNTDSEVYIHVERCSAVADNDGSISTEVKQYECPNCKQYFPGNDEIYLQHLTECYNGHVDNF